MVVSGMSDIGCGGAEGSGEPERELPGVAWLLPVEDALGP